MITNFKIFENTNEPEVDDWVIAYDEMYPFLRFSLGQIERKESKSYYIHFYNLVFSDGKTPYNTTDPFVFFNKEDIKYWSKNREDVEEMLKMYNDAKNYNL